MHTCVYVGMYLCTYTCVYIYMCIYTYIYIYVSVYVYVYRYTHAWKYIPTHVYHQYSSENACGIASECTCRKHGLQHKPQGSKYLSILPTLGNVCSTYDLRLAIWSRRASIGGASKEHLEMFLACADKKHAGCSTMTNKKT